MNSVVDFVMDHSASDSMSNHSQLSMLPDTFRPVQVVEIPEPGTNIDLLTYPTPRPACLTLPYLALPYLISSYRSEIVVAILNADVGRFKELFEQLQHNWQLTDRHGNSLLHLACAQTAKPNLRLLRFEILAVILEKGGMYHGSHILRVMDLCCRSTASVCGWISLLWATSRC